MKYFLDTEFIEDGHTIDLISIGLIAEDGREYYALNYNCDYSKANDWVKENVLASLPPQPLPQLYATPQQFQDSEAYKQGWRTKDLIADEILEFIGDDPSPEFWGNFCATDWVVFYNLWGRLIDKPKYFPFRCNDLQQAMAHLGLTKDVLPPKSNDQHTAIADAKWNRDAFYAIFEAQKTNANTAQVD